MVILMYDTSIYGAEDGIGATNLCTLHGSVRWSAGINVDMIPQEDSDSVNFDTNCSASFTDGNESHAISFINEFGQ